MPVEFIGLILHRRGGDLQAFVGNGDFAIDRGYVRRFAQAHERAGFDRILVGYFSNGADGFVVASYAAFVTQRLGLMLAHRPGFVAPTLAARKLATLDTRLVLELAPEVGALLERRELEMGHARALLALSARRQQAEVALIVAKKSLSVRETEALVRRMQQRGKEEAEGAVVNGGAGAGDPDVRRLEQDLADKLGAKVLIQHSQAGKGKLVVSYNSLDELEGILSHIQ